MVTKHSKIKILFYIALALTALITVMRTVSMLTVYETEIGYYQRGAILPIIQKVITVCSVIFILVFSFIIKKGEPADTEPAPAQISVFSSFLCGTLQFCSAVLLLLFQRGSIEPVTLVMLLGFAFATAYFFYNALCPHDKKSPLCILPAMAAIIGLVSVIVKVHVDYTVPLNNPNKTLIFIAFATVSLFIVQELRFTVGIPRPRLYLASAAVSLLLCSSLSIPGIIGHYTNLLSGGDFLIYYMVTFGYAVYIFVRLFTYVRFCDFKATVSEETPEAPEASETAEE